MSRYLDMPVIGRLVRYAKIIQVLGQIKTELAMSEDELCAYQLLKLKKVMAHAYEHIDLYRNKWDAAGVGPEDLKTRDDLVKFPVVTKDDLRSVSLENIINHNSRASDAYLFKTSGSSGTPISVLFDRNRGFYEIAIFSSYSLKYHLKLNLKRGMFITVLDDDAVEILPAKEFPGAKRFVIDALESPERHIEKINDLKPDYLGTYPSVLKNIAVTAKEKKKGIHQPKLLMTTGESQDAHTRRIIKEIFTGELLDGYASTEMGGMAIECSRHRGLHVLPYRSIIEIADDRYNVLPDGRIGNVVATDLNNFAFPIIRYAGMGDISGYKIERCDCHLKHFPLLGGIEGRRIDSVVLPGNKVIHPFRLTLLMQDIPDVKKFQIRQEKKDEIKVLMVKDSHHVPDKPAVKESPAYERLKSRFQAIVGQDVNVMFEHVADIPRKNNSHKFQTVVSLVRQ